MKQKIKSAIRMGRGKVFKTGDEEALAKIATSDQIAAWTEAGAVEGFTSEASDESSEKPKGKGKK